mmetsp:Transcript_19506/g.45340  ORF Transcript_19506/g.45340 Transcript_19506/m.45340 type:complete len:333 (-) Transcript_19506:504-1502(-)
MLETPSATSDATLRPACAMGVTSETTDPTTEVTSGAMSAVMSSTCAVEESTSGAAPTRLLTTELEETSAGSCGSPWRPSLAKVLAPVAASRRAAWAAGMPLSTAAPKACSAAGRFLAAKSKPTAPARSPARRTSPAKRPAAGRTSFSIFSVALSAVTLEAHSRADSATGSSSSTVFSASGRPCAMYLRVSAVELAKLRAQGSSCFVKLFGAAGGGMAGAGAGADAGAGAALGGAVLTPPAAVGCTDTTMGAGAFCTTGGVCGGFGDAVKETRRSSPATAAPAGTSTGDSAAASRPDAPRFRASSFALAALLSFPGFAASCAASAAICRACLA